MSSKKIELFIHYRARHGESIDTRHDEVSARMKEIQPPLGWRNLDVPPAPDFGEELLASFSVKYPIPGLRMYLDYVYREKSYQYTDEMVFDDKMVITFRIPNSHVDYREILHLHLPAVTKAFHGYMAKAYYDYYFTDYRERHRDKLDPLKARSDIDVDGRNNIFTLNPAQYWDAELCQRALGYGSDEVIRRLEGKVPLVKPLMDGVYTVFNDDPNLSFDEFCAVNDRFKPILGLA